MTIQRVLSVLAVLCATALLTGCFVVSKNLPAGKAINDERLVGAWIGVEDDGRIPSNTAFLHFQNQDDPAKPLRLVWVDGKDYQVYEVVTLLVGNRRVFAATLVGPNEAKKDKDMPRGYFLGFYEVNGDKAVFHMLDSDRVGEMIKRGEVKGFRPPGKYESATLTGTPAELAQFLTSPAADAARVKEPAYLRRLSQENK